MADPQTLGQAFAQAMQTYEAGDLNQAQKLAAALNHAAPQFGGAHYLLGLIALDQGRGKRAVQHLAQAIAITPRQVPLHHAMARALDLLGHDAEAILHLRIVLDLAPAHGDGLVRLARLLAGHGQRDEALDLCRKALSQDPTQTEANHMMGLLLMETGDLAAAQAAFRTALSRRPDWPVGLNNYGLCLLRSGDPAGAIPILEGALSIRPDMVGALINLSAALRRVGRAEQARPMAERATRLDKRNGQAWAELGLVRQGLGQWDGAAAAFERAVSAQPKDAQVWFCLAETRRHLGQPERARKAYERCLALDPDDRCGAALGLALAGGEAPAAAPAAYVRQLFDDYADRFDQSLVEKLDYRAPAQIREVLDRVAGPALVNLDIMDLGCGTGLAGPYLKPLARRLDGLDLSAAMLDKARLRGLYDDLIQADLVQGLRDRQEKYDVIAAADVLVYVGDLAPCFAAVAAALRDGGLFAFSVEKTQASDSYVLGSKQRYAHAPAYVERVARAASLLLLSAQDAVTRRDAGQDVPGMIYVLKRQD